MGMHMRRFELGHIDEPSHMVTAEKYPVPVPFFMLIARRGTDRFVPFVDECR